MFGPRHRVFPLVAAALPLLVACSESDDAAAAHRTVAGFCEAVAADRPEDARALLVAAERNGPRRELAPAGLRAGYEVRPAKLEGGRATVAVDVPGSEKPVVFVVLPEAEGWRISLTASMNATLGDRLEHVRKVIDQAGRQMVERFEQTRRDAAQPATPR